MIECVSIILVFIFGFTCGVIVGVKAGLQKAIEMTEEAFPDLKSKGRL